MGPSGFDVMLPRYRGPHVANQRLVVDTADLTAHWPRKSQFNNIIDASPILSAVHLELCVGPAGVENTSSSLAPWAAGTGSINSRAEMRYEFLTAEVRQRDMHVLTVASLTRSCKFGRFAPLLTRWWWLPCADTQFHHHDVDTKAG